MELGPEHPHTLLSVGNLAVLKGGGINAAFSHSAHCVAAEPLATFLRVAVTSDSGRDVAYESAVLGRLRRGYRVFQLRGLLGTRIELCYLLVKISFGSEANLWPSARQVCQCVVTYPIFRARCTRPAHSRLTHHACVD